MIRSSIYGMQSEYYSLDSLISNLVNHSVISFLVPFSLISKLILVYLDEFFVDPITPWYAAPRLVEN